MDSDTDLDIDEFETRFDVPDPETWYQVSRSGRTVARLPEGKSGRRALEESQDEHRKDWARGFPEGSAGEHYLRCYAPPADHRRLNRPEFDAFRKAGGSTYAHKWFDRLQAEGISTVYPPAEVGRACRDIVEAYALGKSIEYHDRVLEIVTKLFDQAQASAASRFLSHVGDVHRRALNEDIDSEERHRVT